MPEESIGEKSRNYLILYYFSEFVNIGGVSSPALQLRGCESFEAREITQ